MVRVVIERLEQKIFLTDVRRKLVLNTEQTGRLVGICGRSYRDWINGKLLPKKSALEALSKLSGISMPRILEEKEEWWSGRVNGKKGGLNRIIKYGVTLTQTDRIKGGYMSQVRRRENPDYYRALGCNIPNDFVHPRYSEKLAEMMGIILGDGGITNDQCEITLHVIDDVEYAKHVKLLFDELFGTHATICSYPKHRVIKVVISGVKLVSILESLGLRRGNKVVHQVDMPDWVKQNPNYLRACMRGLFDTDGGTFTHKHKVGGKEYYNFGLTFTSASVPLLESFKTGLLQNGFGVHSTNVNVFLYGTRTARRFFDVINPSNPKSRMRLNAYLAKREIVK